MTAASDSVDPDRLDRATDAAVAHLLSERTAAGHWEGELSTSALSTAVAAMALHQFRRARSADRTPDAAAGRATDPGGNGPRSGPYGTHIDAACRWLLAHRNADGGWGDTVDSKTNVSTTALALATLSVWEAPTENAAKRAEVVADARAWFDAAGGFDAVVARYGKDKTFSVPILTHCALAGLVPWDRVTALPFELATLPPRFYAAVRLPVVSYALPALIAIGQLRHAKKPSRNPLLRGLRAAAVKRTLDRLESIQPSNGGFLEAAPLTGFVLMSLSAAGRADHPVAKRCAAFLTNGVREDGSWPIDTNLATWVTTLAVNALGDDLPAEARPPVRDWLLGQQFREVHPYTRAAPGGWAWTDLPGGVPDADDTPGALLALRELTPSRGDALRRPTRDAERPAAPRPVRPAAERRDERTGSQSVKNSSRTTRPVSNPTVIRRPRASRATPETSAGAGAAQSTSPPGPRRNRSRSRVATATGPHPRNGRATFAGLPPVDSVSRTRPAPSNRCTPRLNAAAAMRVPSPVTARSPQLAHVFTSNSCRPRRS